MDAAAYDIRSAYPQACFLLGFADCCVSGIFSGFDLARDECPGRFAVISSGHQDTEVTGNDGSNNRESCHVPDYSGGVLNFSIASAPVSDDTRFSVQGPELTSPSLPNPAHWPFIR